MSRNIIREIARLGWPVFIAQIAVMANGVIDTIMAGHYSTTDLAAVGVGASIYFSVFIALMGVLLALTPIASQLYGAGRYAEIGEEVRQAIWLAVVLSAVCFLALRHPDPFFAVTELQPEVERKTRAYLEASSWGVPGALLFRVFYGFSTAVSRPRVVMALNLFGLVLKVPLSWMFIYGELGAPELGGPGCAVASSIMVWIVCVLAWLWCFAESGYRRYGVFARWSWPRAKNLWHQAALGLPIGVTFFVDVTGFTFMALFIARLGPVNSAAHQIAANFAALLFMLPLALGIASSVLVGQAIGAHEFERARWTGLWGIGTAIGLAFVVGASVYFGAGGIASLYSSDPGVRQLAATLLALVSVYHLADAVQAVAVNVLRGYKRAVVPMVIYAVALWGVGLGGGYTLGLAGLSGMAAPLGAPGFWIASTAALFLAGGLVTFYFLRVSRAPLERG